VSVVFPAYPVPANLSYYQIGQALELGNYTNVTRGLMLQLEITEVWVSGQNTVSFLPYQLAPLLASSDFTVLLSEGDVTVLDFDAGASASGCTP
ncbi:MAG: hypothetical protein ACREC5_06300, partial [Thermoplasmata archaeon]